MNSIIDYDYNEVLLTGVIWSENIQANVCFDLIWNSSAHLWQDLNPHISMPIETRSSVEYTSMNLKKT